jgi:hypothetical protein
VHSASVSTPRALRSRRPASPPSVAWAAPSVRTIVIIGVPLPGLPAGVMGLQAPGKVRYIFTRVPQISTISHVGWVKVGARQAAVVLAKRSSQGSAVCHGLTGGGVGRADEE